MYICGHLHATEAVDAQRTPSGILVALQLERRVLASEMAQRLNTLGANIYRDLRQLAANNR